MKVSLNGFDVHYRAAGDGPPLVLIHGIGFNSVWWEHQLQALGRAYRVLAIDLRGFGDSHASHQPPPDVDALVEDLRAFVTKVAPTGVSAIGHSLGGMLLLKFAAAHPQLLTSMVLAGASASFTSEPGRKMLEARIEVLEREGVKGMIEKTLHHTVSPHFAPGFMERHPEVVETIKAMFLKIDPKAYISLSRAIMRFDVVAQLGQIRCPTLIIVGEHDNRCPIADASVLNMRMPTSWMKVFPDTGHSPMVEQPDFFNDTVTDFLRRSSGR